MTPTALAPIGCIDEGEEVEGAQGIEGIEGIEGVEGRPRQGNKR